MNKKIKKKEDKNPEIISGIRKKPQTSFNYPSNQQ